MGKDDNMDLYAALMVHSSGDITSPSTITIGLGEPTVVQLEGQEAGSAKQVFTSQGDGATPKWTSVVNSLNGSTGDITGIATTSQLDNKQDKITSSNKLSSSFIDGLGAAAGKAVDTVISANSTSTNLPTSKAVEDRINAHSGIDKVGTVTGVKMNGTTKNPSSGVVDIGTVLTDASKFATSAQGTKADNAMPKSGGTFTGEVKFGSTENFQGYYIKRMIGSLGAGTAYANLDSSYKDGTWHRMWRLRFPSGSNFWGKIKITLYGGYSSFNASGVMSKSITCNFNTSNIYNNVGCYDGLGVNVEQDFRISEAIWNATVSAWEVLIWQKNLNGNNSPTIMLECWTTNNTSYINAFNGIAAQTVELTQSTSYSAQRASSTGGTKTVTWATLPVYENPLGEEIATVAMLEDKQDKITSSNKLSASLVSGLSTVATSGSYDDLANKPSVVTTDTDQYDMTGNKGWTGNDGTISIHRGSMTFSAKSGDTYGTAGFDVNNAGDNSCGGWSVSADVAHLRLGIDGACDIQLNENAGTSGQVLTSQGAGNTPIWTTPSGGGATDAVKYTAQTLTASQNRKLVQILGLGQLVVYNSMAQQKVQVAWSIWAIYKLN